MFIRSLKTLMITAAFAAILTVGAAAASTGGAEVKAPAIDLLAEPTATGTVITQLPQSTLLVVNEKTSSDWLKVVYHGAVGYVSADAVSSSEVMDGSFGFGTVVGSGSLLGAPSPTAPITATLGQDTQVDITGVYGEWYAIRNGSISGFILSDSIALNGGVSEFAQVDNGQLIVDTAMQYLDVPYVWGGTSPRGFDCSGLVYYVYQQCGYTINRTAASIYNNGTYVEQDALQPGDAICFSSYSNSIGHVGIYIGDGQFIHASSGSGRVIISGLDEGYYSARYVGARHIV